MSLPDGKSSHKEVLARRGGEVVGRLRDMMDELSLPTAVGVEVGVYRGALSACVLTALPSVTWHMVDRWEPPAADSSYAKSGDSVSALSASQFDEVYRDALARVNFAGGRAVIHRGESVVRAQDFDDDSVDLVFIDGDHSVQGVTADLDAWYRKVKTGGWIGGHDWRTPGKAAGYHVGPAVTAWLEHNGMSDDGIELGVDRTWFMRVM